MIDLVIYPSPHMYPLLIIHPSPSLPPFSADVDTEVSRRSIRSIGRVAFRLPSAAPYILEKLLEFLELDMNDVRPEAVLVLKDLLRKYPDRRADGKLALLCSYLFIPCDSIGEPESGSKGESKAMACQHPSVQQTCP